MIQSNLVGFGVSVTAEKYFAIFLQSPHAQQSSFQKPNVPLFIFSLALVNCKYQTVNCTDHSRFCLQHTGAIVGVIHASLSKVFQTSIQCSNISTKVISNIHLRHANQGGNLRFKLTEICVFSVLRLCLAHELYR